MKSLKELYRIGKGPSSSHTMGPQRAAKLFLERCANASSYEVTLYGALAATGKGHMTDVAIEEVLKKHIVHIFWEPQVFLPFHPNGMKFVGRDLNGDVIDEWIVYSIGGGAISDGSDGQSELGAEDVYDLKTMAEIQKWCYDNGRSFWEYVEKCEDPDIWDYLRKVWDTMKQSIHNGLSHEGVLPGPLKLQRKAAVYHIKAKGYRASLQSRGLVYSYALAVSEENASGGTIVTAPTCGACGVLPAVLYHMHTAHEMSEERILRALATAGLVGNIVKHNASISGADVGCQGEVGYAAEMGLEHHLGMTCDPVCGLVQIPCIERNAFAAARALDADLYASFSDGHHSVSFDRVVEVMRQTGHDLPSLYKETSEGGLAKGFKGE